MPTYVPPMVSYPNFAFDGDASQLNLPGYWILYNLNTGTMGAIKKDDFAAGSYALEYVYDPNDIANSNWPTEIPGALNEDFVQTELNNTINYLQGTPPTPGGYETIGGEAYLPSSISEQTRERQERTRTYGGQASAWIGWPGTPTTPGQPGMAQPAQPSQPGLPPAISNAIGAGASTTGWTMTQPSPRGVYTVMSPDQKTAFQIQINPTTGKHDIVRRWYADRPDVSTFEPGYTMGVSGVAAPTAPATTPEVPKQPIVTPSWTEQPSKLRSPIEAAAAGAASGAATGGRRAEASYYNRRPKMWVNNVGYVDVPIVPRVVATTNNTTPPATAASTTPESQTPTSEPTAPWLSDLRTGAVPREWEFPLPGLPPFPTAQQWYRMSESEKEGLKGSVETNQGYWPDYYDWMIRSWVPGTETRLRPKWGWS